MDIDYRMPAGYWEAGSNKSAAWLAKLIQQLMNIREVKVRSHYVGFSGNRNFIGYDVKLDLGESVSIKILDDDAGSTLKISIFLEDKDRNTFLKIWQNLTNEGYVFDEHFKREIKPKEEKQEDVLTLTYNRNQSNSTEMKKYIVDALQQEIESPNVFECKSIQLFCNKYYPQKKIVLETFKLEYEEKEKEQVRKKQNKVKGEEIEIPKFDSREVTIGYFVKSQRMAEWKKEQK